MRAAPAPAAAIATATATAMLERAQLGELRPAPGASPGLLRRRYSVPETIMRKYRLAQQRSDVEESPPATDRSPPPPRDTCCSACDTPHRVARRDRELMRKTALLRRQWGRAGDACQGCCRCGEPPPRTRETRSLDGSRSELRPLSGASTSTRVAYAAGWATPKRQRLDSARDFRGSDEMLRAAMRNSYDRAAREPSDCCTYRSHRRDTPLAAETATADSFTDTERSKVSLLAPRSAGRSSDIATLEIESSSVDNTPVAGDGFETSLTATTTTYSTAFSTTKESIEAAGLKFGDQISRSGHIDGRISERSNGVENDDTNLLPYDKPLTIDTPSYELLEIVVSETLDTSTISNVTAQSPERAPFHQTLKAPSKSSLNITIDEYVSNILVESLNSLTDQLESMNASIGSDRKISIVEKEIKVKLQNTGVNTIVHLSPTSNNQIIFGNEELCHAECRDTCNNPRELSIRDERAFSPESNNNGSPADAAPPALCSCDTFDIQHDNVNQAVLQQIQRLFQDELHNLDSDVGFPNKAMPEISHIQVSNVDVFLNNNSDPSAQPVDTLRLHASRSFECEPIGGVGTGNYFNEADDTPVVPRFSAFPHTDSMEVNTSSSDDAELVGSDCTSLVDSLDDPNSPRSVLLRRSFRRGELVRSTMDVLDLLPENVRHEEPHPKDRAESFFIRIKDDACDCDKENINVADHMPEKIKQRLYRRHRKRELRMECARRSRTKQMKREADRQRHDDAYRIRREAERECAAIVSALIDDVIAKIAQEEYKCMRIKHRPNKMASTKSDENDTNRKLEKQLEPIDNRKPSKNRTASFQSRNTQKERHRGDRAQIRGKLSLLTQPAPNSQGRGPKRIYQKSEIHEGNKCIEILEILEYVNESQSSPETATSDENQNHSCRNKKSRIPVPVHERPQRPAINYTHKNASEKGSPVREHNGNSDRLIADMLLQALGNQCAVPTAEPPRRAEPRSRSNSLRFRRTFDIIPEERSSISLESGAEDAVLARRDSAPGAVTRSAGTTPIDPGDIDKRTLRSKNQTTMTSPSSKSAATSPLRGAAPSSRGRAWLGFARQDARASIEEGSKARPEEGATLRERRPVKRSDPAAPPVDRRPPARALPPDRRGVDRRARGNARHPPQVDTVTREPVAPRDERPGTDRREERRVESQRRKSRTIPVESSAGAEKNFSGGGTGTSSSDSSESGSLLCSLAPRWLAHARNRRAARRPRDHAAPAREPPPPPAPAPQIPAGAGVDKSAGGEAGGWSVTVAGSCRAALPADVEMRLRFPNHTDAVGHQPCQECTCAHCAACSCSGRALPLPHPAPRPLHHRTDSSKLTLTMKKEALDSSILASKSSKKSNDPLPDLETYRASRSKLKSSVKTRRGYSLHCWLPESEPAPIRESNGLSVLGCAIIPELKPRVPTMSERDLTRVYTPRHYLRS